MFSGLLSSMYIGEGGLRTLLGGERGWHGRGKGRGRVCWRTWRVAENGIIEEACDLPHEDSEHEFRLRTSGRNSCTQRTIDPP